MDYAEARTRYTPCQLGGLIEYLPNGSPLWLAVGGPRAWSDQTAGLLLVEYRLRILAWQKTKDGSNNNNPPEMQEPPKYAHEEKEEQLKLKRRVDKYLGRNR